MVSGIWGGGTPDFLFRNNAVRPGSPTPTWLKVRLQGTLSNALGIGTRVRLVAGGLEQVRQIAGSTGYLSQDAPEALFGLGSYTGPIAVEVRWPSGRVETWTGVTPNQVFTITEPTGRLHDMAMVDGAPAGEAPINTPLTPMATVRNLGAVPDQAAPVVCTITRGGATGLSADAIVGGGVAGVLVLARLPALHANGHRGLHPHLPRQHAGRPEWGQRCALAADHSDAADRGRVGKGQPGRQRQRAERVRQLVHVARSMGA